MARFTHQIIGFLAALCAPALGDQRESQVLQLHDRQTSQETSHTQGCSSEMLWVARQFETLLTRGRPDLLVAMFTNTGVAITESSAGSLDEVLSAFVSSLGTSVVQEEGVFCGIVGENMAPQIALRFNTFDTVAKESTGTFMAQFLLEETENSLFLIARAEIFSNSFAQPVTDLRNTRPTRSDVQCPQEAIQLALGYVAALGARDHESLAKMFLSSGHVLSTSSGLRDPGDFFSGFLTTLQDARAVDTALFCAMRTESPSILVRFDFFYLPDGESEYHEGVFIDQFDFVRVDKYSPLRLNFVHMFGNPTVQPSAAIEDASYMYSKHGGSCSYEALELVREYLTALRESDPTAATEIFSPQGVLVMSDVKTYASSYYAGVLAERSLGAVIQEAVFCQKSPGITGPEMAVRFYYTYTAQGTIYSSDFFGQLQFARVSKDDPLRILRLELFENSLNQALPPPWYTSYLLNPDHQLQHEEQEKTKLLVQHSEVEGCSSEAFALVAAYFHALENDVAALETILAPGAVVMSPHAGSRLALEFYASIMPLFEIVSAEIEVEFCQMHELFGTIAIRSALTLDDRVGVTFSHFFFVRNSRQDSLKLSKIEIFDNRRIMPLILGSQPAQEPASCARETYNLVEQYFHALARKNSQGLGALFSKGGMVTSSSTGVKNAKDYYQESLPLLSDVKIGQRTVTCETPGNEAPVLTATYVFSYSFANMRAESKYSTKFHFVRENTYLGLKLQKVDIVQVPR